ncbi:hypothetical protein D3C86_1359960 [compost metagenome]
MHRTGHGEGLQGVEAEAEGHQQQYREQHRHPALTEAVEDVEGRTAAVGAVGTAALVQLRQRALEVAGGHAEQGNQPHPEDRAGAAEHDRYRHASDVAGADAAGDAEHQRLERAELAFLALGGAGEDLEHVAEVAQLHHGRTQSEEQADTDQGDDEDLAPEQVVEKIEHGGASLVVLVGVLPGVTSVCRASGNG